MMTDQSVLGAVDDQSRMPDRTPESIEPSEAWRECPYIEKDIYHAVAWLQVTGAIEFKAQHTTKNTYSGNKSRVVISVFDKDIFEARKDSHMLDQATATVTLKVHHPGALTVRCFGDNHLADAADTRMWYRRPDKP